MWGGILISTQRLGNRSSSGALVHPNFVLASAQAFNSGSAGALGQTFALASVHPLTTQVNVF